MKSVRVAAVLAFLLAAGVLLANDLDSVEALSEVDM